MADQTYWDDVNEGDSIPELRKNCSTQQLVHWAAASGDFYQIHYDLGFAKNTGLDNIIVHGALKNAFLGQLLHDWAAPGGVVREFGCEYRGMDYPDQDITCKGVVTAKSVEGDDHIIELDIWTENPDGQKTTPGTARVVLPAR
ncbi:MAG: MaoC/PaaZ C-terminal domain-containing protein [Dehalococcoidia bacterium]|jgi:acyl dehydratase|nr:MaoC/PaaZ C-terminal domain-containing protein [Dehalococcoidia bacterium]